MEPNTPVRTTVAATVLRRSMDSTVDYWSAVAQRYQGEEEMNDGRIPGHKLSRRGVLKGTAATGAAALLGGIGQANAIAAGGRLRVLNAAAWQEGGSGTLIISVPTAPDIFDPHATGGWDTYKHTLQMFEGLSRENLTDPESTFPELEPCLAESWDISDDGLRIHLPPAPGRQVPRWHRFQRQRRRLQRPPHLGQGFRVLLPPRQQLHLLRLRAAGRDHHRR